MVKPRAAEGSIWPTFRRISLPLAAGAGLNQLNRAITAVIGPELAVRFHLTAADLGLLGAAFFAAYGLAQIPVGAALDRFGPRRVQAALMGVIAIGALVFATAGGFVALVLGRVLMGLGVAAALMAQLKATRAWFPLDRVPAVTGWCVALSSLGGIVATVPVAWANAAIGWRGVFLADAAVAALTGLWIWRSVPDLPQGERATDGLIEAVRVVGRIVLHPTFVRLVPLVVMLSALNFVWQGLWAGPWLRDVAGLGAGDRAQVLFVYAVGLTLGSFASGSLQSALVRRGVNPLALLVACAVGLLVMHGLLIARLPAAWPWLWFAWPFLAAVGPVGYMLVGARFAASETGRVSTTINALMLLVVFVMQQGIGILLDAFPRTASGGWDPRGYDLAIALSAAWLAAALAWLALRKDAGVARSVPPSHAG
ncbi:MAG: MFS transporter [Elioraea sp.]|nr:MFS transporter [Elioraea sp.]MDW8444214.1 MFS transporter [Acetobacteraceae bacterium]